MRFKNSKCAEQENARLKNANSYFKLSAVYSIILICCQREAVAALLQLSKSNPVE